MRFKVGDVVVLKSGGPPMTITKELDTRGEEMHCSCSYFDATNDGYELREIRIAQAALRKPKKGETCGY